MDRNNPLDFLGQTTKTVTVLDYLLEAFDESPFPVDEFEPETSEMSPEMGEESSEFGEEESPTEELGDHRTIISELQQKISDLKEEITTKLKPAFPEDKDQEIAEALDDATSALDLASHHLQDVDNSLSGEGATPDTDAGEESETSEEPSEVLEDEFGGENV
jgi:hypothetical protein